MGEIDFIDLKFIFKLKKLKTTGQKMGKLMNLQFI
jgi:hypothetical protein